jgi:hypothetical protein
MLEPLTYGAANLPASALDTSQPRREIATHKIAWALILGALTLTVFEGAIRKWLIGSAFQYSSYLVYFSKDLVFALILWLPRQRQLSAPLIGFRRWLVPGAFLLSCGALSSSLESISPSGAILTLRAALVLPLLAFLIPSRLRPTALFNLVWLLGILTIVNFALGTLQNQLPPSHPLNRYVTDSTDIATAPTGVRATGTFSYITGLAVFSTVGVWCGMVGLSLARNLRQQLFANLALAAGFACALVSVSRGPVIMGSLMLFVWLIRSGFWTDKKARSIAGAILLLVGAALSDLTATFRGLGEGLRLRAETSNDTVKERALGQFDEAFEALSRAPFGNGIGTEQVGRTAYSGALLSQTTFESQLPRIILELGIFGLAGFVMIGVGAIAALEHVQRRCSQRGERDAVLATQLFMIASFCSNIVFNHVASAFAWLIFTAVIAALPREEQN